MVIYFKLHNLILKFKFSYIFFFLGLNCYSKETDEEFVDWVDK
jgi:hypothetical protein